MFGNQNKTERFIDIFIKRGIYLFKPFCAPGGNYNFLQLLCIRCLPFLLEHGRHSLHGTLMLQFLLDLVI